VTPIRPSAYPVQQPANPAADAARVAAQRAFFDAAMGRANAPAASAPSSSPPAAQALAAARAPAPVQRAQIVPDPNAPAPAKVLRPGSLLDIRV
jgi:hypothetical protein